MTDRPVDGPELQAAIDWWANLIVEMSPKHETGDTELNNQARWFTRKVSRPVDPGQITFFKSFLRSAVLNNGDWVESWERDIANNSEPLHGSTIRWLTTNYEPEGLLADAIYSAGIDDMLVPMKSKVRVDPGMVVAARGYGAPFETIYP